MKYNLYLLIASLFLLSACANQPDYQAADRVGADGYSDKVIDTNRYQVRFTGDKSTSAQNVKDYALLRAGELALEKGYSKFRVVTEKTETDNDKRQSASFAKRDVVVRDCGLLGCNSRVYTSPEFGAEFERSESEHQTTLEILMLDDESNMYQEAYVAADLVKKLREKLNLAD